MNLIFRYFVILILATSTINACTISVDKYQLSYDLRICNLITQLKNNLQEKNTLLLYGPIISGKTTLAHLIAQETNREIITINTSSLTYEMDPKQGELKKINDAIHAAQHDNKKVILLFEYIDTIAMESSNPYDYRTFMQQKLINLIETVQLNKNIFFIFCTEDSSQISDQFMNKIDIRVPLSYPNESQRKQLITCILKEEGVDDYEERLKTLVEDTEGLPLQKIKYIFKHCKTRALRAKKDIWDYIYKRTKKLNPDHFYSFSRNKISYKKSPEKIQTNGLSDEAMRAMVISNGSAGIFVVMMMNRKKAKDKKIKEEIDDTKEMANKEEMSIIS